MTIQILLFLLSFFFLLRKYIYVSVCVRFSRVASLEYILRYSSVFFVHHKASITFVHTKSEFAIPSYVYIHIFFYKCYDVLYSNKMHWNQETKEKCND